MNLQDLEGDELCEVDSFVGLSMQVPDLSTDSW